MQEKNYEDIGRYTVAYDDYLKLSSQRHNLAGECARLLNRAYDSQTHNSLNVFDHAKFAQKAQELAQVNMQLLYGDVNDDVVAQPLEIMMN